MRALFPQPARKLLIERGDSWGNLRVRPWKTDRSQGDGNEIPGERILVHGLIDVIVSRRISHSQGRDTARASRGRQGHVAPRCMCYPRYVIARVGDSPADPRGILDGGKNALVAGECAGGHVLCPGIDHAILINDGVSAWI